MATPGHAGSIPAKPTTTMAGMELPYLGYTYGLAGGGEVAHRLDDTDPAKVILWARPADGPQVRLDLTRDETIRLAASLLRDVLLGLGGIG